MIRLLLIFIFITLTFIASQCHAGTYLAETGETAATAQDMNVLLCNKVNSYPFTTSNGGSWTPPNNCSGFGSETLTQISCGNNGGAGIGGKYTFCENYTPPLPCPSLGTSFSTGYYDLGTSDASIPPTTACDGGCETSYNGGGVSARAMVNGVFHYFSQGSYIHTGQNCSGGQTAPTSSASLPPNTCSSTQDKGQVNGVTVCLDNTQTNTTNTTNTAPVTNPDGSTSTTSTSTTNNVTNNTTNTTTTTTTTAPDGTVTQSTSDSTTKNSPSNFCEANPTDPTCLKNSKFCEENPETLACATLGTVTDSVVPTVEKGISEIIPKTVGGAGACPAPVTSSFMGRTISFSYDLPCQAAGMLRPLILALAWLASALIFIGGVKQ